MWEVFRARPGDRRRFHPAEPEVRLGKRGVITFNKAAMGFLNCQRLELLHDLKAQAIAFRPAHFDARTAYKIRPNGHTGNVVAIAFSEFIGHDRLSSNTYPATWDGHQLVVPLGTSTP